MADPVITISGTSFARSATVRLLITASAPCSVEIKYANALSRETAYFQKPIKLVAGTTTLTDYAPPLDVPLRYQVQIVKTTGGKKSLRTLAATPEIDRIDSEGAVFIRSLATPIAVSRVVFTEAPQISYDAQADFFWPGQYKSGGRAIGSFSPRQAATASGTFFTTTSADSRKFRSLIRTNPVMVQWPGFIDSGLERGWYAIGQVDERILDLHTPAREWTFDVTPVYSPLAYFESRTLKWSEIGSLAWSKGMTYDEVADLGYTYDEATGWALEETVAAETAAALKLKLKLAQDNYSELEMEADD